MDAEKTRKFYERLTEADLCDCESCRNYMREIKKEYPQVSGYLESLGVDIEKPFEAMSLNPDENGIINYIGVQYIVFGDGKDFKSDVISGVNIGLADYHPDTGIDDEHFVMEIYPITLSWVMGDIE